MIYLIPDFLISSILLTFELLSLNWFEFITSLTSFFCIVILNSVDKILVSINLLTLTKSTLIVLTNILLKSKSIL